MKQSSDEFIIDKIIINTQEAQKLDIKIAELKQERQKLEIKSMKLNLKLIKTE